MIKEIVKHGLPEPEFEGTGTSIVVTFRKSLFKEEYLEDLNERQKEAIDYLKEQKTITSKKYSSIFGISERMARNDLIDLIDKVIVTKKGKSKKGTYYTLTAI